MNPFYLPQELIKELNHPSSSGVDEGIPLSSILNMSKLIHLFIIHPPQELLLLSFIYSNH